MSTFEPFSPSLRACAILTVAVTGAITTEPVLAASLQGPVCRSRVLAGLTSAIRRALPRRSDAGARPVVRPGGASVAAVRIRPSAIAAGEARCAASRIVSTARIGGLYGP